MRCLDFKSTTSIYVRYILGSRQRWRQSRRQGRRLRRRAGDEAGGLSLAQLIVCRTVTSNVPDAETIFFIGVRERERETGRKGTERER